MQLIGMARLGREATTRKTNNDQTVANLTLAYNYGRKSDDGKQPTQWVDASLWGRRAEALAQYLTKGRMVCVTIDDVHIETYDRQDGSQGTKLVGQVSAIELAGGGEQRAAAPAATQAPAPSPRPAPKPAPNGGGVDGDAPF